MHNKILIKQSYILLAWIDYIVSSSTPTTKVRSDSEFENPNTGALISGAPKMGNSRRGLVKRLGVPSLFVQPIKNYKVTLIKSPMAHKTFSQEQFMVRYYSLSLSFYTKHALGVPVSGSSRSPSSVQGSLYYALLLARLMPQLTTNMLFLKKYQISFSSSDEAYFGYCRGVLQNSETRVHF